MKTDFVKSQLLKIQELLIDTSDLIWEYAETRFEEHKSSKCLQQILKNKGFEIDHGLAGMDTAFIARYGTGKPEIAFLGEFDALSGLNQKAGICRQESNIAGGNGHGCGHHLLGTGSLGAALLAKEYLKKEKIPGTVLYYGCPGEEGGSGKAYLAREGLFNTIDAALSWHPGAETNIWSHNILATVQAQFKFHGKSSHASASPHLGRSALDAVEIMNIGANFLREHVMQESRIHYAITDAGGTAPNVVQAHAAVLYQVRAPESEEVSHIFSRIQEIAKGAALITGTSVDMVFDRGSSNMILNRTLEKTLFDAMQQLGPVPIDKKDILFAKQIRETFTDQELKNAEITLPQFYGEKGREVADRQKEMDIIDFNYPHMSVDTIVYGSTDVGDVSWNVPVGQFWMNCFANGTPAHSWQLTAQGKSSFAHKGMLHASKLLALAAIHLFENPQIITESQKEFKDRLNGRTYTCPIPADVKPAPSR